MTNDQSDLGPHCLPVCKNRFEKFARLFSSQHKQTAFSDAGFLGILRVNLIWRQGSLCFNIIFNLFMMAVHDVVETAIGVTVTPECLKSICFLYQYNMLIQVFVLSLFYLIESTVLVNVLKFQTLYSVLVWPNFLLCISLIQFLVELQTV